MNAKIKKQDATTNPWIFVAPDLTLEKRAAGMGLINDDLIWGWQHSSPATSIFALF